MRMQRTMEALESIKPEPVWVKRADGIIAWRCNCNVSSLENENLREREEEGGREKEKE